MALRCLLFSSDEGLTPPIWQVLADLGIEGEYCGNAVEAVERVTTQIFQIVITDWDDQPEAGFLLKTAREQKAANRPLTLAIVSDDSHLPLALQAGANSILRKPLAPEQVRDTLGTARDLLRAKLDSASAARAAAAASPAAFAAAASASPAAAPSVTVPIITAPVVTVPIVTTRPAAPASVPASLAKAPENPFRKGEFLQSTSSDPGKHFDTGTDTDAAKAAEQAAIAEQDPLTELEPMAAAVEAAPEPTQAEDPQAPEKAEEPQGWTSVKARLARLRQEPAAVSAPAAPKTELLAYSDNAAQSSPAAPEKTGTASPAAETHPETREEAKLFAYMAGESSEEPQPDTAKAPNRTARYLVIGALAASAVVAVVKIPAAQQLAAKLTGPAVHAGKGWLNPPNVSQAQAPTQHETFGQAGDEYKLPVAGNIPDATTDPSQIRVLPVVDPTIKPGKGSAAGGVQTQTPAETTENPSDPNQAGQAQATDAASQNPDSSAPAPDQSTGTTSAPILPVAASPVPTSPPPAQVVSAPIPPAQSVSQPHPVSVVNNAAIPSSLKSQMASMTPEASGTKPVEAALQSIQPVDLPESAARNLLLQQIDPAYPDSARKTRQQGNVVLSVSIAADGSVQDAKFMQGSLVFARSAIDAVRQWRFKPYVFNGRPTAAQTVITINFRPPAS